MNSKRLSNGCLIRPNSDPAHGLWTILAIVSPLTFSPQSLLPLLPLLPLCNIPSRAFFLIPSLPQTRVVFHVDLFPDLQSGTWIHPFQRKPTLDCLDSPASNIHRHTCGFCYGPGSVQRRSWARGRAGRFRSQAMEPIPSRTCRTPWESFPTPSVEFSQTQVPDFGQLLGP